jgi:hypothetical protein
MSTTPALPLGCCLSQTLGAVLAIAVAAMVVASDRYGIAGFLSSASSAALSSHREKFVVRCELFHVPPKSPLEDLSPAVVDKFRASSDLVTQRRYRYRG